MARQTAYTWKARLDEGGIEALRTALLQGAIAHGFAMHQLCHAHNMAAHGMLIEPSGILSEAVPFSAAKGQRPKAD